MAEPGGLLLVDTGDDREVERIHDVRGGIGEILGRPVLEGRSGAGRFRRACRGDMSSPLHPSRARSMSRAYNTVCQVGARGKCYKNIAQLLQEYYRGKRGPLKRAGWILGEDVGREGGLRVLPSLPCADHFQGNEGGIASGRDGGERRPAFQGPEEAASRHLVCSHPDHPAP